MFSLSISILNINFILFLHSIEGQRRVTNGTRVGKSYVVYLLHDKEPETFPQNWACGGAIIHPRYILTHDICTRYHQSLWVIPGYNQLVRQKEMTTNACTRKFRIRVTYVCRFKGSYFSDESYLRYCSYKPTQIRLTYREQSYAPGVDAIVYGWGSHKYFRPKDSSVILNSQYLMGTPVKMIDTNECRKIFQQSHPKDIVFRNETICSDGAGNVDVHGNYLEVARRNNSFENDTLENDWMPTRRVNGPCQNDQGSPLVTWMGGVEYIIGIVSAFYVNQKMECLGPYIYISVAKVSKFLNCMLSQRSSARKSDVGCDEFDLPNSTVDQKDIDWEADLASLYFDNDTQQAPQNYWLYSDEK